MASATEDQIKDLLDTADLVTQRARRLGYMEGINKAISIMTDKSRDVPPNAHAYILTVALELLKDSYYHE